MRERRRAVVVNRRSTGAGPVEAGNSAAAWAVVVRRFASEDHEELNESIISVMVDVMKACVQRVSRAKVSVSGETVGEIGLGMLVLLGVAAGDSQSDARYLAEKIAGLRIFEDGQQKMNLALKDVGGAMLVVSQFTLLGDCRKGRRPSFDAAAPPESAEKLYQVFLDAVRAQGLPVAAGRFRETMQVELVNDGPVTLLLDSKGERMRNEG